jgi:hypothetical protein
LATVDEEEEPRRAHPESAAGGRVLRLDDVLDLHQLLKAPEWFAELVAGDESRPRRPQPARPADKDASR